MVSLPLVQPGMPNAVYYLELIRLDTWSMLTIELILNWKDFYSDLH